MENQTYPKITIVTASYNQGRFIERTILSVLAQQYPNLEYIIIDGGSTDGTLDIIKKYSYGLAYWCSEPDKGQYHAINKGFSKTSGEIMGFLNADDLYLPWTLSTIASIFSGHRELEWLTSLRPCMVNGEGNIIASGNTVPVSKKAFMHGLYIPGNADSLGVVVQEGTFWRRSLWEKAGGKIEDHYKLAADFDLWCKFFEHAEPYGLGHPLAAMTRHDQQRSNNLKHYIEECRISLGNLQRNSNLPSRTANNYKRITSLLRKNHYLWAVGRRMLKYEARIINPVFDNQNFEFGWRTEKLLVY